MTEFKTLFQSVLFAMLKGVAWLVMAIAAVFLLALALVLIAIGLLWALLRGKKPEAPVFVGRFHRYAQTKVWPGRSQPSNNDTVVVDVQVKEVHEEERIDPPRR
jgi:hypothetical protein